MATMELNSKSFRLVDDLLKAAGDVPQLQRDILRKQADIVEPALKSSITGAGLVDTGQLRSSIKRSSRKKGNEIRIGPSGERAKRFSRAGRIHRLRNGHLGYIYEYGLPGRGIVPKRWMSKAVASVQEKTLNAAEQETDQFLKKQNL